MRTIDGDARRQLLARAVWTLMRRGGLEAASVRAVAAEAGLSMGSVRHFFASQDELHVFAMQELFRAVGERARAQLQLPTTEEAPTHAREQVQAALLELLPTTEKTAADYQAHLQFITKAVVHRPLAETAAQGHHALEDLYRHCLTRLADAGTIDPNRDLPAEARTLAVVMDGLVLRHLTAPDLLSEAQMVEVLDAHLDSLRTASPEGRR